MLDIEETKKSLLNLSVEELHFMYDYREKMNKKMFEQTLNSVSKELEDTFFLGMNLNGLDDNNKFRIILSWILNSNNPSLIEKLFIFLKNNGYRFNSEFILSMQAIDDYQSNAIKKELLKAALQSFFILNGYTILEDGFILNTLYGKISIASACNALGLEEIPPEHRQGYCHSLTSLIIAKHTNLFGAYYHLPLLFKGYFEHSVIIDSEKNMVYDLANNCAISLNTWENLFGNPTFAISGKDFLALNDAYKNSNGENINTAYIECARIRAKK